MVPVATKHVDRFRKLAQILVQPTCHGFDELRIRTSKIMTHIRHVGAACSHSCGSDIFGTFSKCSSRTSPAAFNWCIESGLSAVSLVSSPLRLIILAEVDRKTEPQPFAARSSWARLLGAFSTCSPAPFRWRTRTFNDSDYKGNVHIEGNVLLFTVSAARYHFACHSHFLLRMLRENWSRLWTCHWTHVHRFGLTAIMTGDHCSIIGA